MQGIAAEGDVPKTDDVVKPSLDVEEMMRKWMEVAAPGDPHRKLDYFVGRWETTSRVWMEGPGSEPTVSKGNSEFRWIMDGRFLLDEATGVWMDKPFRGMGITGYDNFKKRYVSFWIDNMGTAMYTSQGSLNPSGKVFTYFGTMDEPMTGEHDKTVKYTNRIVGEDEFVFEIHDLTLAETHTKMAEITYRRKK
jgi:hypothetical protein